MTTEINRNNAFTVSFLAKNVEVTLNEHSGAS